MAEYAESVVDQINGNDTKVVLKVLNAKPRAYSYLEVESKQDVFNEFVREDAERLIVGMEIVSNDKTSDSRCL